MCVIILQKIAELTGTTYEFVNVILFCLLMPAAFIILIILYNGAKREAKKYKELYHKFLSQDMNNLGK
ncbi:MAG: hypothetical protein L0Y76_10465 [Ignavibacteria bacterium]|nr:hypothetical protein [Ignavibacteria bacterium]